MRKWGYCNRKPCVWAWIDLELEWLMEEAMVTADSFRPIPTKEENHYALNYGGVTVPMSDLLKEVYAPSIRMWLNTPAFPDLSEVWWITKQRWKWKRRFINGRRRLAEAIAGQKFCNDWDCYCGREDY